VLLAGEKELVENRHKLRTLRRALKWTQKDLAERSGVGRSTISKIERGHRRNLRTSTLQQIAGALGVAADELLLTPPVPMTTEQSAERSALLNALTRSVQTLDDDQLLQLRDYVDFLRSRRADSQE
jgi:transcriptional regulator with XRE-family HTH domain